MLFVYMDSTNQRISVHQDSEYNQIRAKHIPNQRVIYIDSTNVESELQKLRNKELTFAATRGLNDVWFYIDLENASLEENFVKKIHEILGNFYKRIAHAEIKYHCSIQAHTAMRGAQNIAPSAKEFKRPMRFTRGRIPDRENKIYAIIKTITTRISDINSLYRSGPSLYFYKRILSQRRKYPNMI